MFFNLKMVGLQSDALKCSMGHVQTLGREVHGSKKGGKSFVNFSALFHTHQTA